MTFRDLIGRNDITIYTVSRSGSISKHTNMKVYETFDGFAISGMDIKNLDSNKIGVTENGNVSPSWGTAVFLDFEEAASLYERMAKTKYENSIKKINEMRKLTMEA